MQKVNNRTPVKTRTKQNDKKVRTMCKKLNYCQTYIVKFGLAKGLSYVSKLLVTKRAKSFLSKQIL